MKVADDNYRRRLVMAVAASGLRQDISNKDFLKLVYIFLKLSQKMYTILLFLTECFQSRIRNGHFQKKVIRTDSWNSMEIPFISMGFENRKWYIKNAITLCVIFAEERNKDYKKSVHFRTIFIKKCTLNQKTAPGNLYFHYKFPLQKEIQHPRHRDHGQQCGNEHRPGGQVFIIII